MHALSRAVPAQVAERPAKAAKLQSGALAYKIEATGKLRILLVRTRRSKRWSIPKGNAEPHLSLAANAAKEAFEEAGIKGDVAPQPAGMFRTTKRIRNGTGIIEVWVYLMRVTEQVKHWPEEGQRDLKWVSADDAVRLLGEPLLVSLCRTMAPEAAA